MIVAIVSAILGLWSLVVLSLFVALFMAFFFRDPRREPPIDPNVVVAPADGKVTRVVALDKNSEDSPTLVSIFLSPLDVHINRAPIPGTIKDVVYSPVSF
jgi:phosphatidylserine decarboxylase